MNILWDFDGTLFDTYPAYTQILKQVLAVEADSDEIYAQLKISFSNAIEFYKLTAKQIKEIDRLESELSSAQIKPFVGVEEVLKIASKNVIMTHKDRKGALAILKHYGWDKYFIDIVTIDDGFPRKPDTSAYEYLHNKHHIHLAIGDREIDILPAQKLGIKTCLFQNKSQAADYNLNDYSDFFDVIQTT